MNYLFDMFFAIVAKVIAHYICKWLDCKIIAKKDSKPTR